MTSNINMNRIRYLGKQGYNHPEMLLFVIFNLAKALAKRQGFS